MSLESASSADVMATDGADFTLRRRGRQILIHPQNLHIQFAFQKKQSL